MAAVASTILMETTGNKHGLYALFDDVKNGRSARPEGKDSKKQSSEHIGLEAETAETASESINSTTKSTRPSKGKRRSTAKDGSVNLDILPVTTASEAHHSDMRNFVQMRSRNSEGSGVLTPVSDVSTLDSQQFDNAQAIKSNPVEDNLESDLNYDRRKRVKPTTPESEPRDISRYTGAQLVQSIIGSSSPVPDRPIELDESRKLNSRDVKAMNEEGDPALSSSLKSGPAEDGASNYKLSPSEDLMAKKVLVEDCHPPQDQIGSLEHGMAGSEHKNQRKGAKNMLLLNSNGRLSPQKTPTKSQRHPPLTTSESRSQSGKELILKIRHGGYSSTPESFCKKIEDILCSKRRYDQKSKSSKTSQNSSSNSKSTHPFFSKKPAPQKPEPPISSQEKILDRSLINEIRDPEKQGNILKSQSAKEKSALNDQDHDEGKVSAKAQPRPLFPNRQKSQSQFNCKEAPWPTKDTVHTRGLSQDNLDTSKDQQKSIEPSSPVLNIGQKKLKANSVTIAMNEDVVKDVTSRLLKTSDWFLSHGETFTLNSLAQIEGANRPERLVISGPTIQRRVRSRLGHNFGPSESEKSTTLDSQHDHINRPRRTHVAIEQLYKELRSNLTPYDKSQSENTSWCTKYAPRNVSGILQNGREGLILRDWVKALTVDAVDKTLQHTGSSQPTRDRSNAMEAMRLKKKKEKKKRKRTEGLDNFIVSSDEDTDRMSELSEIDDNNGSSFQDRKSVVKSRCPDSKISSANSTRLATVVVLSGPNGCGKTAMALAVAKELDFEVFEINPGTRRSGKEILERVGDMTQNHLVQPVSIEENGSETTSLLVEDTTKEIESGRQGTMNSFFKSKSKPEAKPKAKNVKVDVKKSIKTEAKQPRQQKQSVILLEEADILFEEDKQFWMTVIALAAQSRRPIIITCNDESLIPLDSFSVHAILRLVSPPRQLLIEYLLLIAANEGHILARNAVEGVVAARRDDVRASIMDLDFWCQMGVGDRKGGLEWLYQRWPLGCDIDESGDTLRVVSEDTYRFGMGWLGTAQPQEQESFSDHQDLFDAWNDWAIDVEDWNDAHEEDALTRKALLENSDFKALAAYDDFLEAMSAADMHSGPALRSGNDVLLDLVDIRPSAKTTSDVLEGYSYLQCSLQTEYDNLSTRISIATKCVARQYLNRSIDQASSPSKSTTRAYLLSRIGGQSKPPPPDALVDRASLDNAFSSIAAPIHSLSSSQPPSQISDLDRPISLVAEDIAPYIRQIIAYDQILAQQRRDLSNLLSQGGRKEKRARTTRASRSALEGGPRASTRREKWFPGPVDHFSILKTGGKGWADSVERRRENELRKGEVQQQASRSSSVNTVLSSSSDESL